jgi:hypothetical protein
MCFRVCPCCGREWQTLEDFLVDSAVILIGYQAHCKNTVEGFFLFNHEIAGCGTTMAMKVSLFRCLYGGPVYSADLYLTDLCERHCNDPEDIEPCSRECGRAYVREVIQEIVNRKVS